MMLMSDKGDVVVNGVMHGHRMNYHHFIRALLAAFPDMQEGDIYLSNHPYAASIPHTPDLGVVMPAFVDGELVGFSCSLAHKSDFGGSVVGSASMGATHLFQEGLLLPPLRYARAGVVNEIVNQVISANVRNPDLFFGDMRAQLGVTKVGAERFSAIARQLGVSTLREVYDELLDQGERHLRDHLQGWPDGSVTVEGFIDNDGITLDRPIRLALTVTVAGEEISFDSSASDDQTPGPVNMTIPYNEASDLLRPGSAHRPGVRLQRRHAQARHLPRSGSVLDPRFPGSRRCSDDHQPPLHRSLLRGALPLRPRALDRAQWRERRDARLPVEWWRLAARPSSTRCSAPRWARCRVAMGPRASPSTPRTSRSPDRNYRIACSPSRSPL